ncbi:MAG: trigger factor [Treponema sp.]|nr:trigger factor [Treponema sp.]
MAVTQEIERLDNSAVRLTFTYKNEELRAEYNKIVGDFAKKLQISGFRKGKVPISVLESKMGKALLEDVLNMIIGNTVNDAIKSEDFPKDAEPLEYSEPQVEGEPHLDLSSDLVFSVKYDVMPKIDIQKWEDLEVEVDTADVTDADVDRELENVRERNAIVMDKDEGAEAAVGDVVTVDYSELSENGKVIYDTEREDFTFTLGSGRNIFKFDNEIIGMKKDETRDIKKDYPQDYDDEYLAGKTKHIRVKLTSLKRKELPGDDELAQDVDEKFKTIADLKQHIRKQLKRKLEYRLKELKIGAIFEKLRELNPAVLPESMVDAQVVSSFRQTLRGYRLSDQDILTTLKFKDYEVYSEPARRGLHSALIMSKLETDLDITITDEDFEKAYAEIAEDNGLSVDDVKNEYEQKNIEYLVSDIRREKLIDILFEKNKFKTGKKLKFLDIVPENV